MQRKIILTGLISCLLLVACKVTFITGYDAILDQTLTKMKSEFNIHFIKFQRSIHDNDPNNQKFENFLDYYDHMEADLITIKSRSAFLTKKSGIVVKEVNNLDSLMHAIENFHKAGVKDNPNDDKHDISDAVNASIDAMIKLQEDLKTSGSTN